MADMSPAAVTQRLRMVSALLAARGWIAKGVDMSPAAVTGRLRAMGGLTDMCVRLGRQGRI